MKLWRVWSVFGLGAVAAAAVVQAAGCGPGNSSSTSLVGQPPAIPGNPTPATQTVETFAIRTLYLGEADRSGDAPSNTAWKSYGYNLDGKVTTKTSTDVCTLVAGAPTLNQVDGNNGIDNSFGSVILPIVQSAASLPTPSQTISTAIDQGKFTIMLQITGLDATSTQNAVNLQGQIFAAGAYPGTFPGFLPTTDWPVNPSLLNDYNQSTQSCPSGGCLVSSGSTINFNKAYISNGTFVSGDLAAGGITVTIALVFDGVALSLSVNHAVITFNHGTTAYAAGAPTGITADATKATDGTIAGVINTTDLINGLKAVAGRISTSLCGTAFNGIAQQIMQASDIIHDGSNVAGTTCDGISIGLGFDAVQIMNPDTVSVSDGGVPPDPCTVSDAGTNDSGSNDSAADGD